MTRDPMRTEQWLIIGYNLILLLQVFVLGIPAGNVLLIFWFENVLLGIVALVSLLRARRGGDIEHPEFRWDHQTSPANVARWPIMWVFGYYMFTGVGLVFLFPLAYSMGIERSMVAIGVPVILAIGRETASALQQIGLSPSQRNLADRRIVADAKTRMIVLHATVVLGWGAMFVTALLLDELVPDPQALIVAAPFVLLVGFKTLGELVSLRRTRRITQSTPGQPDASTAQPA